MNLLLLNKRLIGFLYNSFSWSCANSCRSGHTRSVWSSWQSHHTRTCLLLLNGSTIDLNQGSRQWLRPLVEGSNNGTFQRRTYAKKAKKTQQRLDEGEVDVIDLERLESSMQAAINALKYEYTNTVIARITPATLDRVNVEVEGQSYSLKQVAQIGMPNPSMMVINLASYPQAVEAVVSALRATDLNLNPIPEKNVIKVPIPKMSKELRESLVKLAKTHAEKARVGIRKTRQKGITDVKKKDDVSKDTVRRLEKHIQQVTDDYTHKVDEMLKAKTTELTKGA